MPKQDTKKAAKAAAIAAFEKADGTIDVDAMIRAVKKAGKSHILYNEFEWDVDKAAWLTWRAQARRLISECRDMIEYREIKIACPRYVSDPRNDETSYVSTNKISRNKGLKNQIL